MPKYVDRRHPKPGAVPLKRGAVNGVAALYIGVPEDVHTFVVRKGVGADQCKAMSSGGHRCRRGTENDAHGEGLDTPHLLLWLNGSVFAFMDGNDCVQTYRYQFHKENKVA